MKFSHVATAIITGLAAVSSTAIRRSGASISAREESAFFEVSFAESYNALIPRTLGKRKGGGGSSGGGGGKGGSSSSSSGSSSGSSGSGSSGTSGSGSSGSSRSGSSGSGGTGNSGSPGINPSFGRSGNKYAGGATTPFRAGSASPARRIAPFLLLGGALAFFPGLWLYGAYVYPYSNPYTFVNRTANALNETLPVKCLCAAYSACGCDEDTDTSYLDTIIGNGSIAALNRTLVNIADVNNTKTIVLNGTLPNGTDSSSASSVPNSAATNHQRMMEAGGFWIVGFIVAVTVWVL